MRSGLGNFIFFRGNPTFTPIPAGFQAQGVTWLIANIERVADAIARFSQLGLGGQLRGGATATEANGLMQGQQAGSEDYTADFALELERMADLTRFLLFINWDAFHAFHGKAITLQKPADLTMRCQVEVNGIRPADTPESTIAKIDTLIATLQKLGIQPEPSTRTVNLDAVADVFLNALNMQSSTAKILQERPHHDPNTPQDPSAPAPAGVSPGLPPAGGPPGIPSPEVLQQLMLGLKAKLAAGPMAGGAGGPDGAAGPPFAPGPMGPVGPGPGPGGAA
jgi:hypothetical protein